MRKAPRNLPDGKITTIYPLEYIIKTKDLIALIELQIAKPHEDRCPDELEGCRCDLIKGHAGYYGTHTSRAWRGRPENYGQIGWDTNV
jgi:hypothetical protein